MIRNFEFEISNAALPTTERCVERIVQTGPTVQVRFQEDDVQSSWRAVACLRVKLSHASEENQKSWCVTTAISQGHDRNAQ